MVRVLSLLNLNNNNKLNPKTIQSQFQGYLYTVYIEYIFASISYFDKKNVLKFHIILDECYNNGTT